MSIRITFGKRAAHSQTQHEKDMEMAQGCTLSAIFHEQRWVKEATHEDADVVQRCEVSHQRDQVVENISTIEFPPINQ